MGLVERFEAKVDRRGEHHRWLGAKDAKGIGHVRVDGRLTTARRVAWELAHGRPVPAGARVAGCPADPGCVRGDHLALEDDRRSVPETPVRRRAPRGSGTKRELRPGVWKLTVSSGGQRTYRTVRGDEAQAHAALAALADGAEDARRIHAPTVDGLVLTYLRHLEAAGRAPSTIRRYRSLHQRWILPTIGPVNVDLVTEEVIDRCLAAIVRARRSPSSVHQARILLLGALRFGRARGLISLTRQ